MTPKKRFWKKVRKEENGCWIWTGARDKRYGVVGINRRKLRAHRVAWEYSHGPIESGHRLFHHCENSLCVNPEHLILDRNPTATNSEAIERRFWAKVDKSGDCWIWTANRTQDSYGTFGIGNKTVRAHRFSWELANGSIPEGRCIRHKCDNPPCVNPVHLEVGTQFQNNQDRKSRGREGDQKGTRNGRAKLTPEQVEYIRSNPDNLKRSELARKFGVAWTAINNIQTGKSWNYERERLGSRAA